MPYNNIKDGGYMKKLKIYLDTSVVSHLSADDTPDKMEETLRLWNDILYDKYDVYLSTLTLEEVFECEQPKLQILQEKLADIRYTLLEIDNDIKNLAQKIVDTGILRQKNMDDCMHIACAVVNECNYILSWNFKHLVNIKTINGVRAITNLTNYKAIDIITPAILIGGENDE